MWLLKTPHGRFFGEEQRKQVEALFNAILPGSDTSPGATNANAAEYLDRLLAMDEETYYEIRAWKKVYSEGLPALNEVCRLLYADRELTQLSDDEVTALLTQLSHGALSSFPANIDQKRFFATLRSHCIEGCFADPRWGGNKVGTMWRWYGYLQKPKAFSRPSQSAGGAQHDD